MNYKKIIAIITLSSVLVGNSGNVIAYAVDNPNQVVAEQNVTNENFAYQLFKENDKSKLAEGVTQSKIDEVKRKVETIKDAKVKEENKALVEKAQNLLQQFNFLGIGEWTFAQLYYHADGSNYAQLKINAGTPHTYISNDYLTVTVKDTSDKVVYNKGIVGNKWYDNSSENVPLKEGYKLEIVKQEPSRFSTNHNDELKQDNSNPYTYIVKNNRLVRINDINRTLKFYGLGEANYANLNINYYSKKITLTTNKVKPHSYFSGSYQKIEVLDSEGKVVFEKDFIGNEVQDGQSESIDFEVGYTIKLTGAEQNNRVKVFNDKNVQDSNIRIEQGQSILLIKDKAITTPHSILEKIFNNSNYTTLVDNLTQAKIDEVEKEVEALPEYNGKANKKSMVGKAENQLQQFNFLGLSNWTFAQLSYHADGSNYAKLKINAGTPHSYVSDDYLTIVAKDTSGKEVYKKTIKGNVWNADSTEDITLKEGYTLEIVKQEPDRFSTNHDDELKQNNSNPYIYMVKNNKLVRINDINRTFKFIGLGETQYATLKVDYNSKKVTLTTNAVKPHSYFNDSYQKIEVLNAKDEVVYTKDIIGNKVLESKTDQVNFEIGYKIRLTGREQNSRVKAYNDKNVLDSNINIRQGESVLVIANGFIENEFVIENNMKQTYVENFKLRLGEEGLEEFAAKDTNHKKFVDWIYNTPEAMKLYLSGGYASAGSQGDMGSYQYNNPYNKANELKALDVWYQIWNKYENSRDGVNLKIAIATSLEFANPVKTWLRGEALDALGRYENFSKAEAEGILMSDFVSLTVQEIRNVVNVKVTNEDIVWLREYMKENKSNMINRNGIVNGYQLIKYIDKNYETGESVHGPNFYGPNPTIKEVIKYGGVCGAMSKLSSILAQSYGIPAFPVGQPGHCAYQYLGSDHEYKLGYDVSGWKSCGNYNTTLPYILVNNIFSKNSENYYESEYYRYKALIEKNAAKAIQYLDESIAREPLNYLAWEEKIRVVAKNYNESEYEKVLSEVRKTFNSYPVIVERLTKDTEKNKVFQLFKDDKYTQLNDNITLESINSLKNTINKLTEGSYKDKYVELLDKATGLVQEFNLLGIGNWNFAKFVYHTDGKNLGTIKINSGKPHYGFTGNYATIKVKDKTGKDVKVKEFNGSASNNASSEQVTLQEGYTVEFILQEESRFNTSNDVELKKNLKNKTYTYEVKGNKLVSKAVDAQ